MYHILWNIELIVVAVKLIPEILHRFDKVDEEHDEIKRLLLKLLPQRLPPIQFPLPPSLHNQTPPEPKFVGRQEMLETITDWYTLYIAEELVDKHPEGYVAYPMD